MTDLQIAIRRLQAETTAAKLVLEKLEKAQKDLETPPQHKWEHGDVFSYFTTTMIYICEMEWSFDRTGKEYVFCISGPCDCTHPPESFLKEGKFLFNIKEKL